MKNVLSVSLSVDAASTAPQKRLPVFDYKRNTSAAIQSLMDVAPIQLQQTSKGVPLPLHYREGFDLLVCAEGERVAESFRGHIRLMLAHAMNDSLNAIVEKFLEPIMKDLGVDASLTDEMRRYMLWKIQDPAYSHAVIHGFGKKGYRYPVTFLEEPSPTKKFDAA